MNVWMHELINLFTITTSLYLTSAQSKFYKVKQNNPVLWTDSEVRFLRDCSGFKTSREIKLQLNHFPSSVPSS